MANVERALSAVTELGNFIRDQRKNARLSLRKLSGMAGISNPYLSQIERGLRRPSAEILQAIAKSLRISAETLYVKAGILEERGDHVDPVTAILRDLTLNEKQKQVLIEIYQSFRHENELEGKGTAGRAAQATARATVKPMKPRPRTAAARKAAPARKAATGSAKTKKASAARAARSRTTAKRTTAKRATAKRATAKRARTRRRPR